MICHLTRASGDDRPCIGSRCSAWIRGDRNRWGWCALVETRGRPDPASDGLDLEHPHRPAAAPGDGLDESAQVLDPLRRPRDQDR